MRRQNVSGSHKVKVGNVNYIDVENSDSKKKNRTFILTQVYTYNEGETIKIIFKIFPTVNINSSHWAVFTLNAYNI